MEGPLNEGDEEGFVQIEPDPWGKEYVLRVEAGKPRIVSFGPDGAESTEDDIVYAER